MKFIDFFRRLLGRTSPSPEEVLAQSHEASMRSYAEKFEYVHTMQEQLQSALQVSEEALAAASAQADEPRIKVLQEEISQHQQQLSRLAELSQTLEKNRHDIVAQYTRVQARWTERKTRRPFADEGFSMLTPAGADTVDSVESSDGDRRDS